MLTTCPLTLTKKDFENMTPTCLGRVMRSIPSCPNMDQSTTGNNGACGFFLVNLRIWVKKLLTPIPPDGGLIRNKLWDFYDIQRNKVTFECFTVTLMTLILKMLEPLKRTKASILRLIGDKTPHYFPLLLSIIFLMNSQIFIKLTVKVKHMINVSFLDFYFSARMRATVYDNTIFNLFTLLNSNKPIKTI